MKVFRSFSRPLLCSALLAACACASAANIEVRVTGVVAGKGKVAVAVCDKDTFLKDCKYSAKAPAREGENVITVKEVPAGTWAVLSYQDENDNGELDRNIVGILNLFVRLFGPSSSSSFCVHLSNNSLGLLFRQGLVYTTSIFIQSHNKQLQFLW